MTPNRSPLALPLLSALACLVALPAHAEPTESTERHEADAPALLKLTVAVPSVSARAPQALRDAARLLSRKEADSALALLEALPATTRESSAASLLLGEAHHALGHWPEAIVAYETCLTRGALLGDRLRLHLGEALLHAGQPVAAASVLGDLEPTSPHHRPALLLRARALRGMARSEEAIALLERHGQTHPMGDSLRLELAENHLAAGEESAAEATWTECVLHCESPGRRRALRALATGRDADGTWTQLAAAERAGALALRAASRARAAERLRSARWAAYLRALAAQNLGEAAVATALFGGVVGSADAPRTEESLRAAALFGLAKNLTTLGRLEQARARWLELASEHPAHPLAPVARIEASALSLRLGAFEEASRTLQIYGLLYPIHPQRPRAFFLWGWAQLRQGLFAEAAQLFGNAASFPAQAGDEAATLGGSRIAAAARARYWHARSLSLAGNQADATLAYRALLTRHPLSYYAALARSQLAEPAQDPPRDTAAPDAGDLDLRMRRAREAAWLGLSGEALLQLRPLLLTPSQAGHPRDLLVAAQTLEVLGRRESARALYRAAMVHDGGGLLPGERETAMQRAFPRLHRERIEREAARWNLSPWLVYGLILRESGFRPCARSRVGAKGLMQLMGPASADAARDLGFAVPSPEALCDPDLNVRLGTWHLTKLLRHYRGSKILAVAAYNAGAGSVDRWLARDPEMPLDIWVEEIPYDETRVYVRAVLSAARGYAWTWDRPATVGVGTRVR